jgi:hypothetical protein
MKKPLLATVVFCGLMGGATAGPTAAEDNKWEADCRRGYITKTFSEDDSSMRIFHSDDGTTIRIEPEEFIDIEKRCTISSYATNFGNVLQNVMAL